MKKKSDFERIKEPMQKEIEKMSSGKKLKFKTVDPALVKKRIKRLEKTIIALDTAFETGEDCVDLDGNIVLDNEYDALKRELLILHPESKIFEEVTAAKTKNSGEVIIHNPPMTSISKCNGSEQEKEEILNKWFKDCLKDFKKGKIEDGKTFTMSYKMDGLAASLEFEKGELKRMGLRSRDGKSGIDVTDKAEYIAGIPQTLTQPVTCKIRGEVDTPIPEFNKNNEEAENAGEKTFSNPRAFTSGNMNRKTASKIKGKGLRFTAYSVVGIENPTYKTEYKTEIERAKWTSKLGFHFVKTVPFDYTVLKIFEENHNRLKFKVDGVVISVSNLELQKSLGNSGDKDTGNPRGKIAFKFKDQIKSSVVADVIWGCGRSGAITPVLVIDPIQLEGTQVQRVTAHNVSIIKQNKIGKGSEIEVIKSGKIIPKLHKVIEAKGKLNIPTSCPSCSSPTKIIGGKDDAQSLICTNKETCPAQNVKNLNHWLKIIGVKGVSGKTIEKLLGVGVIQKIGDFYRLTVDKLMSVGITERTATLIVARIWIIKNAEDIKDNVKLSQMINDKNQKKIKVPMEKFYAGFGILSAGKEAGRILSAEIGDWQKIKTAKVPELEVFNGIGPTMAQEIVQFFQKNKNVVEDVEQYFEFDKVKVIKGKLSGKTFCLSGSLLPSKEFWREQIESKGGQVKSSVGKKLDYLIAGDGSGAKSIKAESQGIPILTVDDLEELLDS
jgi:DNA ligase (NAD+)